MLDYIVAAVLGLAAGFIFNKLAIVQISKRSKEGIQNKLKKPVVLIAWLFVSSLLFVAVIWQLKDQDVFKKIEYLIYVSVVLNIAAVDYMIRKIPNELLLILMLTKLVFLIIAIINGDKIIETLQDPLIGLVVGFVLFSLPSLLHYKIGAGDVKFSAVIGFCLGFSYFLQAMIIMAVVQLVYLMYLMVTHKGNLKTVSAMGPYLAFGVVLTMIFPLSDLLA